MSIYIDEFIANSEIEGQLSEESFGHAPPFSGTIFTF